MTTITIEVTDEQARQLSEEANRLSMTLEELALQSMEDRPAQRKQYMTQAIRRILHKNEELYRRLA